MGCDNPIIKLDKKYDPDVLILQWENLHSKLHRDLWYVSNDGSSQSCLQLSCSWMNDPYTDGAGSFSGTDKVEKDYNILNEVYEGSIFERIILELKGVRCRIMRKKKQTRFSVHSAPTPRYHIAIETNPHSYFLFPTLDRIIHVPADGYVYEVDTTLPHSFVNCGSNRVHLVMSKTES